MASTAQKREISRLLKDTMVRVCRRVVPYSDSFELHGLLMLETDGQEFCTITFKDVKVTGKTDREGTEGDILNADEGHWSRPALIPGLLEQEEGDGEADNQNNKNPQISQTLDGSIAEALKKQKMSNLSKLFKTNDKTCTGPNTEQKGVRDADSASLENNDQFWDLALKKGKNKNGKFECVLCYKEFSFGTNLTRHQRSSHGRPFLRKTKSSKGRIRRQHHEHSTVDTVDKRNDDSSNNDVVEDEDDHDDGDTEAGMDETMLPVTADSFKQGIHLVPNGDDMGHNNGELVENNQTESCARNTKPQPEDNHGHDDTDDLMLNMCDSFNKDLPPYQPPQLESSTEAGQNASRDEIQIFDDITSHPNLNDSFVHSTFSASEFYLNMPETDLVHKPLQRDVPSLQTMDLQISHNVPNNGKSTSLTLPTFPVSSQPDYEANNTSHGHYSDLACDYSRDVTENLERNEKRHSAAVPDVSETAPGRNASETRPERIFSASSGKQYVNLKDVKNTQNRPAKFACPKCGRGFDFYQNLGRHAKVAHGLSILDLEMQEPEKDTNAQNANRSTQKKNYRCDICNHAFSYSSNLYRHKSKLHGYKGKGRPTSVETDQAKKQKPANPVVQQDTNLITDVSPTKGVKAKHKCDLCGVKFAFTSSLSRHMRKAHKLVRAGIYSVESSPRTNAQAHAVSSSEMNSGCDQSENPNSGGGGSHTQQPQQASLAIPNSGGHPCESFCDIAAQSWQDSAAMFSSSPLVTMTTSTPCLPRSRSLPTPGTSPELVPHPEVRPSNPETTPETSSGRTANRDGSQRKSNSHQKSSKKSHQSKNKMASVTSQKTTKVAVATVAPLVSDEGTKDQRRLSDTSPRDHRCSLCNKKFTLRTNMTRHMRKIHHTIPDFM